jgi:hypothetical protein
VLTRPSLGLLTSQEEIVIALHFSLVQQSADSPLVA